MTDELLFLADVAREYGIPEPTLRAWRTRGTGPVSFRVGRKIRYRRSAVEAWIKQQEAQTARGGAA